MDYYKTIWLKRKAQRESDAAKNEAAQALTALSNAAVTAGTAAAVLPLLAPVHQPPRVTSAAMGTSSPPHSAKMTAAASTPPPHGFAKMVTAVSTPPPPPSPLVIVMNSGMGVGNNPMTHPFECDGGGQNYQILPVQRTEGIQQQRRPVEKDAEEEGQRGRGGGRSPTVIRHQQIGQAMTRPRDYHVELESFLMDGKMQPFTVSGKQTQRILY